MALQPRRRRQQQQMTRCVYLVVISLTIVLSTMFHMTLQIVRRFDSVTAADGDHNVVGPIHEAAISVSVIAPNETATRMSYIQGSSDAAVTREQSVYSLSTSSVSSSSQPVYLPSFLDPYRSMIERSELVQLDHCDLSNHMSDENDWRAFLIWSEPTIQKLYDDPNYNQTLQQTSPVSSSTKSNRPSQTDRKNGRQLDFDVTTELRLELLQLYATHNGWCNYDKYRFSKPVLQQQHYQHKDHVATASSSMSFQSVGDKLKAHTYSLFKGENQLYPPNQSRIIFVIVAFEDAMHLAALIDAILLPQHFVIVHLETNTPQSFVDEIHQEVLSKYHNDSDKIRDKNYNNNVAIIQFGTIIYRTDSVSHINLRIMDWIVNDLKIQFDYLSLLDGKSFPLWGATELARHLHGSNGHVWLGEMMQNGRRVNTTSQSQLLVAKSLYTSPASSPLHKFKITAKKIYNSTVIPSWLDDAMRYKTNSGNQGVFSYQTVTKLLSDGQVKLLFYLAQHGCCCCIEERSWIAALGLIGLLEEAMTRYANYQLWGGSATTAEGACKIKMSNEVLVMDPTLCFRSENVGTNDNFTFTGDALWSSLASAKNGGFLFARKFSSQDPRSVELRDKIVQNLHYVL